MANKKNENSRNKRNRKKNERRANRLNKKRRTEEKLSVSEEQDIRFKNSTVHKQIPGIRKPLNSWAYFVRRTIDMYGLENVKKCLNGDDILVAYWTDTENPNHSYITLFDIDFIISDYQFLPLAAATLCPRNGLELFHCEIINDNNEFYEFIGILTAFKAQGMLPSPYNIPIEIFVSPETILNSWKLK